jgi:hypothetical protein
LATSDQSQAIRQARIAAYDFERALRGEPEATVNRAQIAPATPMTATMAMAANEAPSPQGPPETTLRDLLVMFLSDPSNVRSDKTRMIYENAIAVAGEVIGQDMPLRSSPRPELFLHRIRAQRHDLRLSGGNLSSSRSHHRGWDRSVRRQTWRLC